MIAFYTDPMKKYNKSGIEYNNYIDSKTISEVRDVVNDNYCFDEWGLIECVCGDTGVDYNLCIDNSTGEMINESAFYPMYFDGKYWNDETSVCRHYEIDFNDPNWKSDVEKFAKAYLQELMRDN